MTRVSRPIRFLRTARYGFVALAVVWTAGSWTAAVQAQPLGVEMHNTMLPVAGAMGGASIAQPQELLAAVNANPAALTRFGGSQFQFGGGWAEPTFNLNQTGTLRLPGVTPFSAKSDTPGAALANIGMSRQVSLLGADAVFGFALISNAGGGVDFRRIPQSNGSSSSLLILEMMPSFAVRLTERLSAGANMSIGSAYFDGPFVGNGAMTPAFGVRSGLGLNYDLGQATSLGGYWQSRQRFNFEDALSLELFGGAFDVVRDVKMDLPSNVGFGIANRSLLDGRLLLAVDCVYKQWEDARLFNAVYRNQWAFQFGSQYSLGRLRLRSGYTYAQSPIKGITSTEAGGVVPPGGVAAVEYVQSQFANINQNRISAGIGIVDLTPGFDVDLFAGGMLPESASTGQFTSVKVQSYWIGLGATYRFGAR